MRILKVMGAKRTNKNGTWSELKKKVTAGVSGAMMASSLLTTKVYASSGTSAVTQPLDYTDNYINPLAIDVWDLDLNDSKGMIREKGEFMLGLCEQCMGDSLNSRQKSIIDRCVRRLYMDIARMAKDTDLYRLYKY